MGEPTKKTETKRILIYLGITFFITYVYCFAVIYPQNNHENLRETPAALTQLLVAVVMFFPAVGVLLTRLLTGEGFKNAWIHPHLKGNIRIYLLAYFGPGILTLLGAVLYFLVFPGEFDADCGYFKTILEASGAGNVEYPVPLYALLLFQALEALVLGPILNFITCFGEEWGWRGYLLPKMAQKLPLLPMLLVNGLIWGLWHAPLTAIGHNYGLDYPGFPYTGIAAMCGFCIVIGTFLSYVAMKTKSCIPAVLGHGAVNSIGAVGAYFTADGGNPFIGPAPCGIVGMLPFLVVAILIVIMQSRAERIER